MPDSTLAPLRSLHARIALAFEAGAAGQGRELIEQALAESRSIPAYHELFRAEAARHLTGDREKQAEHLEAALELAPDDPFLMRVYGRALSAAGADEEALGWFDRALAVDPADGLALRRKGVSLSRLGRHDEAMFWFGAALEANPTDAAAMRSLGVSLSQCGRDDEALAWFDRALAADPTDYRSMRQRGVSCSRLGRLDEALAWYDRALVANPGLAAARIDRARTLIERGDFAAAVQEYDRLIAMDRRNPYHYLEKAIALARLGRAADALDAVNQAYGLPSPAEQLRRGRAYWLKRLGLDEDAKKAATPAEAAGRQYGDIARVMEKTWEIFRDDIRGFRRKIEDAKNSFTGFLNNSSAFQKNRVFLLGARKWNSFTPTLPLGGDDESSVGGGYFLYAGGVGTVIDPGFDFLENFSSMGGRLADIHNIVITHAHNDHTADLESLLTLFYQRSKAVKSTVSARRGPTRPRPRLNLYLNLGSFQKFSPMINLRAGGDFGSVHAIAAGEVYTLGESGIVMRVLPANHDEIFSKTYAVGLHFTLPTRPAKTILFTGDTGLFPGGEDVTADNVAELEIGSHYGVAPGEVDFFVPHLGSIGDNELRSPDRQERLGESFYPNHLGVQGLIRLITRLRPKYVFVSEFGEELKGFIALLMELITRCVHEIQTGEGAAESDLPVILPMDLFFFCDLAREEIYCAGAEAFSPLRGVGYRHVEEPGASQFYYEARELGAAPAVAAPADALLRLAAACRAGTGPFSERSDRTQRIGPA